MAALASVARGRSKIAWKIELLNWSAALTLWRIRMETTRVARINKSPTRYDLDRIIIGNQLSIMRAIAAMSPQTGPAEDLRIRVSDIKDWWRRHYDEEVGFSTHYGDKPPERT